MITGGIYFASERELRTWLKEQRLATQAKKKAARAERERQFAEITRTVLGVLGTKQYGVVYADPPWRFEPYSRETGMDRAADNHYQTMEMADIRSLVVPAADNAVLFLWATAPMMPEALDTMRAWGFQYKSQIVWVKDKIGTGYWARNKHELLLIGTKGKVPAPAHGQQFPSVVEAPVGPHSQKPAVFAEMIKQMFPTTPAIELFARGEREGFDVWGNQAGVMTPDMPLFAERDHD